MDSVDDDLRLDGLISMVYDAALDEHLWSGVAPKIARAFDSTSTVLKTHGAGDHVELVEVTDNLIVAPKDRPWADYWHRNDLWVERSVAFGLGRIVIGQDLLSDAEFERSGFYQDWNRHLGIYHVVGSAFSLDPHTVGVLGIHRPKDAGAYTEKDRQRVARFLPHLNRALRMRQHFEHVSLARRASLDALDRLQTAVVAIDANCRVLYTNRRADEMLKSLSDIRLEGGRIGSSDPRINGDLLRLAREAVQTASGGGERASGALTIHRLGRLPITALVTPLRGGWDQSGTHPPAALVFIRDPEHASPSRNTLRELFGLTPTEAAITASLAEGHALEEIAACFHIGLGTVRSHVKVILAKTGTHRQAQLVALVANSVASIASTTQKT